MKRLLIAAAFGLTAFAAQAQTSTTTTTTTVDDPTTDTIRTYVTKEKTTSVPAPDGFTVTVGEPLPASRSALQASGTMSAPTNIRLWMATRFSSTRTATS